ncbi:putative ABC transporter, partial [Polyplosphaeria fusca]
GSKLSGGERQQAHLARALAKKSKIQTLDESTSDRDIETETRIDEVLYRLDATILMVAHRSSLASRADYILVLHNGGIKEHGTHKNLLAKSGRYEKDG